MFRLTAVALLITVPLSAHAQEAQRLPYEPDPGFFELPAGWNFGQTPGIAVNSEGHIFVLHRLEHKLLEFDAGGAFVRELGMGLFEGPHGLRIDRDDNIWTTDTKTHQVHKLDPDGRVIFVLGVRGQSGFWIDTTGLYALLFNQPTDIAFDEDGNVYVSDGYGNSRVVKFDAGGNYLKTWGERGDKPGQFDLPHCALVHTGRVLVCDRNNNRIQVFDTEGVLLDVWSDVGRPWGLSHASDGNIWMADGSADEVVKLSPEGEVLGKFGERGKGAGQLGWVHFLDEAADGSVLVGEIVNERPQRFKKTN